MIWLLKLYPREWRRHYGAEIEEVVASQPRSLQLVVDLLGGAVDAHLKPQAFARRLEEPAAGARGGSDMVHRLKGCGAAADMTTREALISAGLTLLIGVVLAAVLIVSRSQLTEAILLSMFPAFLIAPAQWVYLRGHSRLARAVLFVGPFVVCFLIGLVAGRIVSG